MEIEWIREIGRPIFFDSKIGHLNIVGHVVRFDLGFLPLELKSAILDKKEELDDDDIPAATFEYYLIEGMSDKFCRKYNYPANSEEYENEEKTDILDTWKQISGHIDLETKLKEYLASRGPGYEKRNLDEIPKSSIGYLRSRIKKNVDYCIFHVDTNLYFENNPENRRNMKDYYYETSEAALLIRKHNAPKQLYLNERAGEVSIGEAFDECADWDEGLVEKAFFDIWNYVTINSDEVFLSRQVYRENLIELGKLSVYWDYGLRSWSSATGRQYLTDLIMEFNDLADLTSGYFDPLGKFIHSFTVDLHEDMVERKTVKHCEFCGKLFPYKANKLYCSPVSEGRDCGKKARNKRYYIKKSLKNPTEN